MSSLGTPGSPIEVTRENLLQIMQEFKYVIDSQSVVRGRWTVKVFRRRSKYKVKKRALKKFARAGGRVRPTWVAYE